MPQVKAVGEIYRCDVCGNEVIVTKVGTGALVCCGEEMKLVEPEEEAEQVDEESDEDEEA